MNSDSGRSLSAGISIPQWMKSKISDSKFGSEDFLSPPDNDDSFLFIYPKKLKEAKATLNSNTNNNVEIVTEQRSTFSTSETKEKSCTSSSNFKEGLTVDYEKYTAPCKPFLLSSDNQLKSTHLKLSPDQKIKSNGTDDGFKGEAAKCGSSVIKMAHQIVSGKRNESETSLNEEPATPPPSFNSSKRRNSRSLPASPLSTPNTSPKSQRKMNKYFNGAFFGNENYQGSWILSSLLKKRDISKSVDQIVEVDELDNHTQNVINVANDFNSKITEAEQKIKNIYVPKPEEIREMNFWSPTSM